MFHGDLVSELHIEDAATHGFKSFLKRYGDKTNDPNLFVNFTSARPGYDKRFYGQNRPPRRLPNDPMPHAAGPAFLMHAPTHGDPVGMYGYPLEYVIKHPHDIVYGSEGKTLRVLRRTENCRTLNLQRAGLKELQHVLDHLKIPTSAGNFIEWWKKHGSVAYRKPTPGHMIWHLIQHDYFFKGETGKNLTTLNWRMASNNGSYVGKATVGQDEYTANVTVTPSGVARAMIMASANKGGYKQIVPKEEVEIDPTDKNYGFNVRTAVDAAMKILDKAFAEQRDQNKADPSMDTLEFSKEVKSQYDQRILLNKLGWDAVEDTASDEDHAIIYHGEPEQIVFVNKKGFEIEDEFKLGEKGEDGPKGGIAVWNLDDHANRMNEYARKIAAHLGDKIIERTRTPEGTGAANSLEAIYAVMAHGTENAALTASLIDQSREGGLKRFHLGQGTNTVDRYYRTQKGWLHVIILQGGGVGKAGHRYGTITDKTGIAYEYLTKDKFEPAQGFYTTSKIGDVVADQHGKEDQHLTHGDKKIEIGPDSIGTAGTQANLIVRASEALSRATKSPDLSTAFKDCREVSRIMKEAADTLGYPSLEVKESSINDAIKNAVWLQRVMDEFQQSTVGDMLHIYNEKQVDEYYDTPTSEGAQSQLRELMGKAAAGKGWYFGADEDKRLLGNMDKWVTMALGSPVEVDDEMHKIFDLCLHLFVTVPRSCWVFGGPSTGLADSMEAIVVKLRLAKKQYPNMKVDPFKKEEATTPDVETEVGGLAGESLPMQSEPPAGSTPS